MMKMSTDPKTCTQQSVAQQAKQAYTAASNKVMKPVAVHYTMVA